MGMPARGKLLRLDDMALATVVRRDQDADRVVVVVHRVGIANVGTMAFVATDLLIRVRAPLPLADLGSHEFILAVASDAIRRCRRHRRRRHCLAGLPRDAPLPPRHAEQYREAQPRTRVCHHQEDTPRWLLGRRLGSGSAPQLADERHALQHLRAVRSRLKCRSKVLPSLVPPHVHAVAPEPALGNVVEPTIDRDDRLCPLPAVQCGQHLGCDRLGPDGWGRAGSPDLAQAPGQYHRGGKGEEYHEASQDELDDEDCSPGAGEDIAGLQLPEDGQPDPGCRDDSDADPGDPSLRPWYPTTQLPSAEDGVHVEDGPKPGDCRQDVEVAEDQLQQACEVREGLGLPDQLLRDRPLISAPSVGRPDWSQLPSALGAHVARAARLTRAPGVVNRRQRRGPPDDGYGDEARNQKCGGAQALAHRRLCLSLCSAAGIIRTAAKMKKRRRSGRRWAEEERRGNIGVRVPAVCLSRLGSRRQNPDQLGGSQS